MELSDFFNILVVSGFTAFGWFSKELWNAVKDLKKDLSDLQNKVHDNYLRKDDFKDFRDELMSAIIRIESKLDKKADKQ